MRSRRGVVKLMGWAAILLWLAALGVLVAPEVTYWSYKLLPDLTESVANKFSKDVDVGLSEFGEVVYEEPSYQPPFDPKLPKGHLLSIPGIGVYTGIGEGEAEEALVSGVWRVTEAGEPGDNIPMILAAHRFGYLRWSNQYRRENSFFNLPKLANGDTVEVVWGQRRYVYEVFDGYTDTKIRDYDADLILYTCEVLNSDRRIIRVARLIEDDEAANRAVFRELL